MKKCYQTKLILTNVINFNFFFFFLSRNEVSKKNTKGESKLKQIMNENALPPLTISLVRVCNKWNPLNSNLKAHV
jgi:hypothetical protein